MNKLLIDFKRFQKRLVDTSPFWGRHIIDFCITPQPLLGGKTPLLYIREGLTIEDQNNRAEDVLSLQRQINGAAETQTAIDRSENG